MYYSCHPDFGMKIVFQKWAKKSFKGVPDSEQAWGPYAMGRIPSQRSQPLNN